MIKGLDYASVDDDPKPDFRAVAAAGYGFVILRRSNCYFDAHYQAFRLTHDATYERDAQAARDAGITVGSYIFPCMKKGAPSAEEQFGNFLSGGGDILPGVDLPPTIDLEFPGSGIADTGCTQAECLKFLHDMIVACETHLKVTPIIYTSRVQVHDDNGLGLPENLGDAVLGRCPLWDKIPYRLKAGQPVDTVAPAAPRLPTPWLPDRAMCPGWWIRQSQGDARDPLFHQADIDDFQLFDPLAPDVRYAWVGRKAGFQGPWDDPTARVTLKDRIIEIQRQHGLTADAIVGPKTWSILAWN